MKLSSKNSFLKRIVCIALSLMLCLTSFTLSGFAPTLEAEAAEEQAVVSHTKELLRYTFNGSNYSLGSTLSTPDGKTYSFQNWQSGHSVGNGYYYNADGGFSGHFNYLNGKNNWILTYKGYSYNSSNDGNSCEIGFGTSYGDTEAERNTDVLRVTRDGILYVANENKGTMSLNVGDNSATFNSSKINTIVFDYYNGNLKVTVNGSVFGSYTVDSSLFTNINSIFSGVNAALNVGNRQHFVDDIRVTTEDPSYNSYEVNGYVDIDPVIYVHGTFTGSVHDIADNHMYDYMMLGDRVSDGTYDGEYQTNVTVTGKTLESVIVTDTDNNYNSGYVTVENGKLTGKLGGGYGGITQATADSTCTLRFVFADGTYEERTVAVKANPVAVHTIAAMYSSVYQWNGWKYNFAAIGTTAVGSVKGVSPTTHNTYDSSDVESANAVTDKNFADIYRNASNFNVFDVYYDGWNTMLDSMTAETFTTDKYAGYYLGTAYNTNSERTCTAYSDTANYYLDLSSGSNLGITHTAGSTDFSIKLLAYNLYTNQGSYSSTITSSFSGNSGKTKLLADRNISNTNNTQTKILEEVVINGSNATAGETVTGTFSLNQTTTGNSKTDKPNVVTNISIKIVDKSAARTALNTALTNHKYSNCYTAGTWSDYKAALKKLEAYICNYEADTATEQGLISELNTAADGLQYATKSTDTHTACVYNSERTEPDCTEAGNILHKYNCGYSYNETLAALGHSFSLEPKYVEAKGDDNGYRYIACTRCDAEDTTVHRSYDDQTDAWTNYSNQLAVAKEEIKNTVKYTAESIASATQKIQEVENAVVLNDETKSQKFIDDKTSSLATAVTSLKLNQYSITLHVFGENGNALTDSINYPLMDYGTVQNISVPDEYKTDYSVVKWVRDSFDGSKISGLNSDTLGVVVKGNMNYYVVLKDTTGNAGENQAVVTLNNKSGKIVDVGYVEKNKEQTVIVDTANSTIKIGDVTLTAPTYSFYTLKGFYIDGQPYSDTGTVTLTDNSVITPYYEATKQVEINRASGETFTINNENTASYRAKWNQKVVLRSEAEVYWYNEKNVILGRGTTYSFFANTQVTIHTEPVRSVENVDPTASIGYFDYDSVLNKVTVVNNFFVPSGKTAEKAGVILSTKNSTVDELKKQTNGIFEGDSNSFTSTGNQIRISVSRTATTSFKMYALAYVVVDGQTYWANEVRTYNYTAPNA